MRSQPFLTGIVKLMSISISMKNEADLLWSPSAQRCAAANLTQFCGWLARSRGLRHANYEELWQWSVADLEGFWSAVWSYFDVRQSVPPERVLASPQMPGAQWFPGARLNFVEQVFRHASAAAPAVIFQSEIAGTGEVSWAELEQQVAALAHTLRGQGVRAGDRVAAYLPNIPATVIAFLAVASIGAIWSVCAPDMGVVSVTDRFQQIEPKALIAADGYRYAGKTLDRRTVIADILSGLPTVRTLIWVTLLDSEPTQDVIGSNRTVVQWSEATARVQPLAATQVSFDHPLWIVYSSGTTGLPKAIVHGHGGMLATGLVGMGLHLDLKPADRYFWYSSTGWIMWNLQVMGLLVGATICLFDGAVTGTGREPDWSVLWRFAGAQRVKLFGSGAAFYASCLKAGLRPADLVDLSTLESVGSTGSPLSSDCYRWVYEAVKRDVWLLSMAGGTDIAGAFTTGTPTLPVYVGEMQCRNLGAAVHAFDERGHAVMDEVGELVCTRPMPSMPLYFWNDPEGKRYLESYFDTFIDADGTRIWRHGDWLRLISGPKATGAVIYGRSDATINRHGIRMGTSELYRVVEAHPDVLDSIVVDLEYLGRPSYLGVFVVMREGTTLSDEVVRDLKERIRKGLSPRHVPDEVLRINAVPRTLTGKKLEVPLKKLLLGHNLEEVINRETVANPDSLAWFVDFTAKRGVCRK
jgi:acetoacetyl-CoA synthetase